MFYKRPHGFSAVQLNKRIKPVFNFVPGLASQVNIFYYTKLKIILSYLHFRKLGSKEM
jgi:hypothetical protein